MMADGSPKTAADPPSAPRWRLLPVQTLRRPRVLVGLLIATVGTGVATALLDVKVTVGIVGALVMFVIVLQFELLFALSGSDEDAKATLRELAPIVRLHERKADDSAFLLRLAVDQTRYADSGRRPQAFDAELNEERRALLRRYDECAQGSMRIDLRPSSISRETDAATMLASELLATSLVDPAEYWDAPVRLKYLREQEDKLRRGAKIRRIFIERQEALHPLRKVVTQHLAWQEDGLDAECRIAIIGQVQERLIEDYAVVDGETVVRLETTRDKPSFAVWETNPEVIEARTKAFQLLWDEAREPSEFAAFGC
jgi:hypothetical protein